MSIYELTMIKRKNSAFGSKSPNPYRWQSPSYSRFLAWTCSLPCQRFCIDAVVSGAYKNSISVVAIAEVMAIPVVVSCGRKKDSTWTQAVAEFEVVDALVTCYSRVQN